MASRKRSREKRQAAGKEIVALFDSMPARNDAGLPDDYEVTVSYTDLLRNE